MAFSIEGGNGYQTRGPGWVRHTIQLYLEKGLSQMILPKG